MKTEEIIEQAKLYFGKNRKHLKKKVLEFKFDGKQFRNWQKQLKQLTSHPFDIDYGIFDDVVDWLKEEENHKEIDWHWLGDLSWEISILLNEDVGKGYDWDKKLALKCGGTARILQIYVSDIIPCFVIDTYYMTYNKKENYYEFGPISKLTTEDRQILNNAKKFFKSMDFTFLSKNTALSKHKELYSDLNSDGNATLYSALFSDTQNYQTETKRFNDKLLKDLTGKKISWYEYYNRNLKLKKREEFRFYPSKNVECVVTDSKGQIIEVKVWRDIGRRKHIEFKLDILKEYKEEKSKKKRSKKN